MPDISTLQPILAKRKLDSRPRDLARFVFTSSSWFSFYVSENFYSRKGSKDDTKVYP